MIRQVLNSLKRKTKPTSVNVNHTEVYTSIDRLKTSVISGQKLHKCIVFYDKQPAFDDIYCYCIKEHRMI